MEHTIKILTGIKEQMEKEFIENSITCHQALQSSPIPDTNHNLEMVIELRRAIAILESRDATKQYIA